MSLEGMTKGVWGLGKNVIGGFTEWWDFKLNSYALSRMDLIGNGSLALCEDGSGGFGG